MSSHVHPPGTPAPDGRDAFLIDGCNRCAEYVDDFGVSFDPDRFRAFWRKMVDVEYDDASGYASKLDKRLGRRLYLVSLTLHRAFGLDPRELAGGMLAGVLAVECDPRTCEEEECTRFGCVRGVGHEQ
jgi:hypothetical protein